MVAWTTNRSERKCRGGAVSSMYGSGDQAGRLERNEFVLIKGKQGFGWQGSSFRDHWRAGRWRWVTRLPLDISEARNTSATVGVQHSRRRKAKRKPRGERDRSLKKARPRARRSLMTRFDQREVAFPRKNMTLFALSCRSFQREGCVLWRSGLARREKREDEWGRHAADYDDGRQGVREDD